MSNDWFDVNIQGVIYKHVVSGGVCIRDAVVLTVFDSGGKSKGRIRRRAERNLTD